MAIIIAPEIDLLNPLNNDGTRLASIYNNLVPIDVNRGDALPAPPNELLDNYGRAVRTFISVG